MFFVNMCFLHFVFSKCAKVAGLYDLEETLGEGHYAVVKSARHVFTGERVAVKVIDKMKLDAATQVNSEYDVTQKPEFWF